MTSWSDRFNQMTGKTRLVVCRLFLHLAGDEVVPLVGVLNQAARAAIDSEGDLETVGEGLVEICQSLLRYDTYWRSAFNEGDIFWDEGDADDFLTDLFTDSAQRYSSGSETSEPLAADDPLSIPIAQNVVVMLAIAAEGTLPDIETDLASVDAMKAGLKAIINAHYQHRLRAIQVHFSPAQLGDDLTDDQLLEYFPELVPM